MIAIIGLNMHVDKRLFLPDLLTPPIELTKFKSWCYA